MADKKISQLIEITSPNASDVLPIVNAGVTKKVTVANIIGTAGNLTEVTVPVPNTDFLPIIQPSVTGKIRLSNIQPVVVDSDTIDLTYDSNTPRNLTAVIKNNSITGKYLATNSVAASAIIDGTITTAKIDPNAKIGGATGGGTDRFIYENDQVVTTDYTITAGKNAMSAGPITVNNGVTLTIPNGSTYTVV